MEKKKILIVEDEKPMAKALVNKLNLEGFDATPAYDGEEALSLLKKGSFDLVLADLIMPKMNGFELLEALRKENIQTPVIISSNLGQQEDFKKAKELGAVDYFVKSDTPITEVVSYVKRALQ